MEAATSRFAALQHQIKETETQLQNLKAQLASLEADEAANRLDSLSLQNVTQPQPPTPDPVTSSWPLLPEEYTRYGRQMIVPSIGLSGQLRLKNASVLIIGAGGLGCPAAAYIAGAGVGRIGIVDGDTVEVSNLHRQICHSTRKVGMLKVDSLIEFLRALNPHPTYTPHPTHLTPANSASIVRNYDLVLDCTDNPASRYLISDTCILLHKPLISGSALRTDGQLITLNSPPLPAGQEGGGPCYRCVFPKPPPLESVVSCGDGGILGPVVGVMGVLQAVEAVRYIVSGKLEFGRDAGIAGGNGEGKGKVGGEQTTSMLLFSASSPQSPFRSVRLRSRRPGCLACSSSSQLSLQGLENGSIDYIQFCGLTSPPHILRPEERISAKEYEELKMKGKEHVLLDVREKVQFEICSLPGSVNIPFSRFQGGGLDLGKEIGLGRELDQEKGRPIYVVCRLGNDSQVVARNLKDAGMDGGGERYIGDIKGGLKAWREQVDRNWPEY